MDIGVQINARDFIELYDSIAEDATWKNEPFDQDALVKAYSELATDEDRYVALRYLESKNATEILNDILDVDPNIFGNTTTIFDSIEKSSAKVRNMMKNGESTWAIRLEVEEGLYVARQATAAAERNIVEDPSAIGTTYLQILRGDVQQQLVGLYNFCTPEGSDRSTFFDSDGDFLDHFMAGQPEAAFDDKDCDPLVANKPDGDGDLVPDEIDVDPSDPKKWNALNIGETINGKNYDVSRDENGYVIKINIALIPADDLAAGVKEDINDPEYLAELEQNIEEWFVENSDMPGVRLDVEFVGKNLAHAEIEVNNLTGTRTNAGSWCKSDLNKYGVLNHEILHLLALPDNYNEFLVHSGRRDHTFAPGYMTVDQNNVMNGPTPDARIREAQVKRIIANASQNHEQPVQVTASEQLEPSQNTAQYDAKALDPTKEVKDPERTRIEHVRSRNMYYIAFDSTSAEVNKVWDNWITGGDKTLPPPKELELLLTELENGCRDDPECLSIMVDIARIQCMLGNKDKAIEILQVVLKKNKDLPYVSTDACEVLYCLGQKEEAVAKLEERAKTFPDADMALARICKKEGNNDAYLEHLRSAAERDHSYLEYYAAELIGRGDFEALMAFLDSKPYDTHHNYAHERMLTLRYIAYSEIGNKEKMSATMKEMTDGNKNFIPYKLMRAARIFDQANRPDLALEYREHAKVMFEQTMEPRYLANDRDYLESGKGVVSEETLKIQALNRALAEDPTDNELRLQLINAYLADYKKTNNDWSLRNASLQLIEILRMCNYLVYNRQLETTSFELLITRLELDAESKDALLEAMEKLDPIYKKRAPGNYDLYQRAYTTLKDKKF